MTHSTCFMAGLLTSADDEPWHLTRGGRGVPRVDEIAASLEPGPANILTLRLAAADPEAHDARGAHLDRGDADLSVTLGEVRIAGREQRALDRHGQQVLAAFRQMLHVE